MTQAVACPRCGQPIRPTDQFCTRCGAENPDAGGEAAAMAESTPAQGTAWDVVLERLRADTVGVYDVAGELGRGGMAAVYLAHDIALDRKVAIKVMSPLLLTGPAMVKRFRQEAKTVARFDHPNIVTIYNVRQTGDLHYFVMKYVEGKELQTILSEQRALPLPIVQTLLYQVASALDYAHRKGVIHRDIKPSNVMVDAEGKAVVTDFGIAKLAEGPSHTATGATLGTPLYMSPEQCMALPVNPATDQYSLGVVAHHMLTGEPPFTGSPLALLRAHVDEPPPAIAMPSGDCPEHVERAIHRMMAKKPEARFPSVRDAARALGGRPVAHDDPIHDQIAAMVRSPGDVPATELFTTPLSPPIRERARAAPVKKAVPQTLVLSQPPGEITPDETFKLTATLLRTDGTTVSAPSVTWTSSDPAVATVDERGQVTAHAPGTATVTASEHDLEESTEILVAAPLPLEKPEGRITPIEDLGTPDESDSTRMVGEDTVGAPAARVTRGRSAGVITKAWLRWRRRLLVTAGWIVAIAVAGGAYLGFEYVTVPPEPWEHLEVAWSPDGSRLAFLADRHGSPNLYTVRSDGGGLRTVVEGALGRVTWSTDGRWLSFAKRFEVQDDPDGFQYGTEFRIASPDGEPQRPFIGDTPSGSLLGWSPDGARVAFWTIQDGVWQLWMTDPDGSNQRTLFTAERLNPRLFEDRPAVFAPDGNHIAFFAEREIDGAHALHVANLESGRARYVTRVSGYRLIDPSWSPDGAWLVFAATSKDPVEGIIYRVRSDGAGLTRLTDSTTRVTDVQLAPDGQRIAFTDDVGDLYLMNTDGSDRTKVALPDSSVVEGDLSWSPYGARVAFVTSAARRSVLYRYRRTIAVVKRDGSGVKLVL